MTVNEFWKENHFHVSTFLLIDKFLFPYYYLGQLYGIEKFWAFLKYYKNSNQLEVGDKLQGYLNRFKTIDDFRVDDEPTELNNAENLQQGAGSLKQQGGNVGKKRTSSENEVVAAAVMTNDS